ncbi:hypothetical protein AB205_0013010 [Aquarana catesbeiana]|uniref:Uncharacterized protein n=1 Tax=Aquarana catesbeiana TaxID=8400 RepID=A0A2G9Q760_AQUCT|nr:hypothetical protein AB205_0013010 [Aquarana catesbeiana]
MGRKEEEHLSCVWTPVTQHLLKVQKVNPPETLKKMLMLVCRKYCVKFSKLCRPQVIWMLWKTKLTSEVQVHKYSELLVCNRGFCNREKMKQNMHELQNRVINIIDILAKI